MCSKQSRFRGRVLSILPPNSLTATAHLQPLAQPTALRHPGSRCDNDSHPDCRSFLTLIVAPQSEQNRRLALEKDELTEQNGELVSRNGELDTKLQNLTITLELYEEQLAWFKNKLYGRSTEQLSDAERQQLRLFDEIESSVEDEPE